MAEKVIAIKLDIDGGNSQKELLGIEETLTKMEKDLRNISKIDAVAKTEKSFKELNQIVDESALSIQDMTKAMDNYINIAASAGRTSPIGKDAIKRAGALKDSIDGLRMEADQASKDFGNLQAAMQVGTAVIGGYTAIQGTMALLGVENEALMETMVKLQAANSVLMGVESVRQSLEKEGILVQKLTAFWTKVKTKTLKIQSNAKKKDIVVTGAATLATKLFNKALAANPIGVVIAAVVALVAAVGALIAIFGNSNDQFDKAAAKQKAYGEAVHEANLNNAEQVTKLETLLAVAKDETASLEAREQALKEAKEQGGEYLEGLTLQNIATAEGATLIDNYIVALDKKAQAEAVHESLVEAKKQLIDEENKTLEEQVGLWDKVKLGIQATLAPTNIEAATVQIATEAQEENTKALKNKIIALKELAEATEIEAAAVRATEATAAAAAKTEAERLKKLADDDKKAKEARKKQREKDAQDAKKAEEERIKNLIASQQFADSLVIQMMKDGQEKEEALRVEAFEKEIGQLQANGQLTAEIEKNLITQLETDLGAIKEKFRKEEADKVKEHIAKQNQLRIDLLGEGAEKESEAAKLALEVKLEQLQEEALLTDEVKKTLEENLQKQLADIKAKWNAVDEAATAETEAKKQAARKKSLDQAATAIQGLATINNAITEAQLNNAGNDEKKKEEIRKKSFEREKKLNIAMALINGAQSIAAAIATGPPQGYVFAAINAGIMVAQIAAISSAKYSGGGGSASVAAPSTSGLSVGSEATAPTPTGNANQDTTTSTADLVNEETGPTKIFVSAVDISNVQSTSKKIDTIGTVGE